MALKLVICGVLTSTIILLVLSVAIQEYEKTKKPLESNGFFVFYPVG